MSNTKRLFFPKSEKLTSKRIIEDIYSDGQKLKKYPFILNYIEINDSFDIDCQVQIVTAVPKRKIKLASSRNRVKRQIKEAYRLNKQPFIEEMISLDKKMALFLIYIGKEKEDFAFIEEKLIGLLNQLKIELKPTEE